MTVRRRLISGFGANGIGQIATVIGQLLLTPLFLRFWGGEIYGIWLLLSTLPTYLAIFDAGVGNAAGNVMTKQYTLGLEDEFRKVYAACKLLTLIICLGAIVATGFVALLISMKGSAWMPVMGGVDATIVVACLGLGVVMSLYCGPSIAVLRATGRANDSAYASNGLRLAEVIIVAYTLTQGGSPSTVALVMLVIRLAQFVILNSMAKAADHTTKLLIKQTPRASDLQILLKPSLGFVAFPIGNALAIQLPLLIIGWSLGPTAVATFSILRTLSRLPCQVTGSINASFWPEMSRAAASGDTGLLVRLHAASIRLSMAIALVYAIGTSVFGAEILRIWLAGKINYAPELYIPLIISALLNVFWNSSAVALAATNNHLQIALSYVIVAAAICAVSLGLRGGYGLVGVASAILAGEAILSLLAISMFSSVTHLRLTSVLKSLAPRLRP